MSPCELLAISSGHCIALHSLNPVPKACQTPHSPSPWALHPTAGLFQSVPRSSSSTPLPKFPASQTPFEVSSPGLRVPTLPLCPQRRSGRRGSQKDKGHRGQPQGCIAPRPSSTSSSREAVPVARAGPCLARSPPLLTAGHVPSPQDAQMGTEVPRWGTMWRGTQHKTGYPLSGYCVPTAEYWAWRGAWEKGPQACDFSGGQ